MDISCWTYFWGAASALAKEALMQGFRQHGITPTKLIQNHPGRLGVCFASEVTQEFREFIVSTSAGGSDHIIAVVRLQGPASDAAAWDLLELGASDVLVWTEPDNVVEQIRARFERWLAIEDLLESEAVRDLAVGKSAAWRNALRQIAEIARFSDTTALILGESGTGKEMAAQLIHHFDPRPDKREMVIQDCSTVVAELSGSEFFGHERGAFTGALSERHGAFALANGGTLFLDEIGELPLPSQAQLLRVIQEHTYKRVGGSTWRRTEFRLVCATNRDLSAMVQRGEFRADLYFRIAGFVCKLPPLRERVEDVLPLARHFFRQLGRDHKAPALDPVVHDYLLRRDYPGNIRELRQVISRLMCRCADDGTISAGYVPPEERLSRQAKPLDWTEASFESQIRRAVLCGVGLKEIGRAAEDCAIRCATELESGSLQRAAKRLGVTDRALQLRRAHMRGIEEFRPGNGADMPN